MLFCTFLQCLHSEVLETDEQHAVPSRIFTGQGSLLGSMILTEESLEGASGAIGECRRQPLLARAVRIVVPLVT
jgi:hypothetical protein